MKISKSQKNKVKKKIEKIAFKLLNINQKWKNNISPINSHNKNIQDYNKEENMQSIDTQKDILTLVNSEENINIYKSNKQNNIIGYNIKHLNSYSVNNTNKENGFITLKEEEREKSRKKSQIPKNKKEIVPRIKGLEKIAKKYIDKLNRDSKEESPLNTIQTTSNIIENTSESITGSINNEILNQTNLIYDELKKLFLNIQKINISNNIFDKDNNKKDIYFKCKVLAYDYFQFLFGEEICKIITLFNYCLDIGKFIIYQVYLFLSIIYLDENKKLDNTIEMSFKTIIIYSSQNYNNILYLIKNPQYISEPKSINEIKMKNKIIISILKLINPNVPTNSQIKEFINQENGKKQINDTLYKIGKFPLKCLEEINSNKNNRMNNKNKEEKYNSLGIINLIILLKENKELKEKLNQIKNKVLNIYDQKNNNNITSNIHNNIPNQINNINSTTSSLLNANANKLLLPKLDQNKNYKLFLIFELDETLVHFWEEKDNSYVKVRIGVEDFFDKIFDFCEITIVSTSSKEYTDIIVDNINKKKCYIQNRIYKELFDEDENFDLSLINRDKKKCIFICHEEEFFNAPKSNILQLTEFNGEENDREIIFLFKEIMKLKDIDVPDIRKILPEIINNVRV